jgi:hypothetical protein
MLQIDPHTYTSILSTYAVYTNLLDYESNLNSRNSLTVKLVPVYYFSATSYCALSFVRLLRAGGSLLKILIPAQYTAV